MNFKRSFMSLTKEQITEIEKAAAKFCISDAHPRRDTKSS